MSAMTQAAFQASASHMVDTDLGRLHVVDTGTGSETIVLWPSIFTDHRIYHGLVAQMGDAYRFLLIDGPAHGQSAGAEREFTMGACAEAMKQVMDDFGLERAIVGGTSWGGLAAAHLALIAPDRAKAVLLMNTPMEIDGRRPGLKARFISTGARWMLRSSMFRNGVARSFFTPTVLDQNPVYAQTFHTMLKSADPSRLAKAIRSVILRGSPLLPRMRDISAPTLVIAGKGDKMYPVARQKEAASLAPRGHFAPVDGKHISVVENPEQVAAIVRDFLAREVAHVPV
ncbi:alpha/beta fold hydrolase [Jannaschia pohangensis]|uniref:Pimeloyl-ACP methyl ester carboxylesterase n=1 Tax=Jannaschia pohangensis TaxID=390807 RepID=A0A1I3IVD8_9RHOB|nr:alpha/beta hydrolase [Jannaschia pohangensis]SFI51857.1 Pimeloyl-ACP methyl ester carboxylesterase [Jannaschia pohangensis]